MADSKATHAMQPEDCLMYGGPNTQWSHTMENEEYIAHVLDSN